MCSRFITPVIFGWCFSPLKFSSIVTVLKAVKSVLCIMLFVICVMQITSAIPAVIYTNALMGIGSPPSEKHLKNDHQVDTIGNLTSNLTVLKKCQGKLDCLLIFEMSKALWICKKKLILDTQPDSIRAKLFV